MPKKICMVTKVKSLSKDGFQKFVNLKFEKIYILHPDGLNIEFSHKKIVFVSVDGEDQVKKVLKKLVEENNNEFIIPYFTSDANSKYIIFVQNLYGRKIDRKIFKHKEKMNSFINDIQEKKYLKIDKKTVKNMAWNELKDKLKTDSCIIKPTNKAASLETFFCDSEERFEHIKKTLAKAEQYIAEEYLEGNLISVDFLFDGENILLLSHVREISFSEIINKNLFSGKFMEKYGEIIQRDFPYFLPVRYNLNKVGSAEIKFLQKIQKKLKEIGFIGNIHLEYKYDKNSKKIGFIEWGARLGGLRNLFIKGLHNYDIENLVFDVFGKKDISKRQEMSKGIWEFKDKNMDKHIVSFKTNFVEKTPSRNIFKKMNIAKNSMNSFVEDYFEDKRDIKIKNVTIGMNLSKEGFFYPSYSNIKSGLNYSFELEKKCFDRFKKKKYKIIENIVFHDYQ